MDAPTTTYHFQVIDGQTRRPLEYVEARCSTGQRQSSGTPSSSHTEKVYATLGDGLLDVGSVYVEPAGWTTLLVEKCGFQSVKIWGVPSSGYWNADYFDPSDARDASTVTKIPAGPGTRSIIEMHRLKSDE